MIERTASSTPGDGRIPIAAWSSLAASVSGVLRDGPTSMEYASRAEDP